MSATEIISLIDNKQDNNALQRKQDEEKILELEHILNQMQANDQLASEVFPELATLFPGVRDFALLKGKNCYQIDNTVADSTLTIALVSIQNRPSNQEIKKMEEWLKRRTRQQNLQLLIK